MATGIVLLAGSSTRYNPNNPKQFEIVCGRPLFDYSISTFIKSNQIDKVVLVVKSDHLDYVKSYYSNCEKVVGVIAGGVTRQSSVLLALEFLSSLIKPEEKILIQDAARPLVTEKMIEDVISALDNFESCTIASNNKDTLCISKSNIIEGYVDRNITYRIETPQGFIYKKLFDAHKKMDINLFSDDTQLLQAIGIPTKLILSDTINLKITTLSDMELFKSINREFES